MLDSHPEMAVPHEAHLIVPAAKGRKRYEKDDGFDRDLFARAAAITWTVRWGHSIDELHDALRLAQPASVEEAVRAMFRAYAASQGKPRYGEKTPANVLHIAMLASLFAEARFIHIIRDGRNVTLSSRDADFGIKAVGESAIRWRRSVTRAREDGLRLGPDRYLEIRYERLVEDPEGTLDAVCRFVGLGFDPDMLRYFERADELLQTSNHPAGHRNLYNPPIVGTRDWRTQMARQDVAAFEAIAGETLERFGYERGFDRIPVMARVGAGRSFCFITTARARKHAAKRVRKIRKRLAR